MGNLLDSARLRSFGLDWNRSQVAKAERGERIFTLEQVVLIATALDLELAELVQAVDGDPIALSPSTRLLSVCAAVRSTARHTCVQRRMAIRLTTCSRCQGSDRSEPSSEPIPTNPRPDLAFDAPHAPEATASTKTRNRRLLILALSILGAVMVIVVVMSLAIGGKSSSRPFDKARAYEACKNVIKSHGGSAPNLSTDSRVHLLKHTTGKSYTFDVNESECIATKLIDGKIVVTTSRGTTLVP